MIFILIPLSAIVLLILFSGDLNFGGFVTLAIIEAALITGIFAALS